MQRMFKQPHGMAFTEIHENWSATGKYKTK